MNLTCRFLFLIVVVVSFSSCKNEPDNADYFGRGVLDTTIINRDSIRKDAYLTAMKNFAEKKMFLYIAIEDDSTSLIEEPIITKFYNDRLHIEVMPESSFIDFCGNTSYNEEYSVALYQRSYRAVLDSIVESELGKGIYLQLKKYRDSVVVAEKVKELLKN